jgi:hypothetical protein
VRSYFYQLLKNSYVGGFRLGVFFLSTVSLISARVLFYSSSYKYVWRDIFQAIYFSCV